MNRLCYKIVLVLVLLPFLSASAQENELARANKKFDQYAFIDSQKLYLRVVENGYESAELLKKLGDSYYYNAKYSDAAKWYGQLVEKYKQELTPEDYFRYSQALRAEKRYDEADEMFVLYNDNLSAENSNLEDTDLSETRKPYLPGKFDIKKLSINSTGYSDFAPAYYGEKILFSSSRDTGTFTKRVHKWNDQPFLDLYEFNADMSLDISEIKKVDGSINTPYHESSAVLSRDGQNLYFTRNNFTNGDYKKDNKGTNKLKLYLSKKGSDGKWDKAEELPFNSNQYSVAHPALSPDNQTLYFASDMTGTYGESDIWKVAINADGSYGEPQNLGRTINTPGRENFPFVAQSGQLYFCSDGHQGLGGLDIYVVEEGQNGKVINLGEPINSSKDDFTFIYNEIDKTGYFASNRGNDPLDDDIYSFTKEECAVNILVTVVDADTKEPLTKAKVSIRNSENDIVVQDEITAQQGSFNFIQPELGKEYFIRAEANEYNTNEKLISIESDFCGEKTLVLELEKSNPAVPCDIAELLNPILFDFDRWNIRPDAAVELAQVVEIMNQFPELSIDVRSHTDSRGNDDYNMALSEKRNQATIEFIVKGGIDTSRVTGRGYGETRLCLKKCSNGVDCTEEQHQANRRSEFIVKFPDGMKCPDNTIEANKCD